MEVIGLSISQCIKAIIEDKVPLKAVKKIIGNTSCRNPDEIYTNYSQTHWKESPLKAKKVFTALLDEQKIDQPRVRNEPGPETAKGIWLVNDQQMETFDAQKMIALSFSFLSAMIPKKNQIIDSLPPESLTTLLGYLHDLAISTIFPEISLPGSTPANEVFAAFREELKKFYKTSMSPTKMTIHTRFMPILAPHLEKILFSGRTSSLMAALKPHLSNFGQEK